MPKIVSPVCYGAAVLAALASLAIVGAPIRKALGNERSTPFTVVNPSTSPVLTSSIDNPGRIAYQSGQIITNCEGISNCEFNFPPVPAGHRLVVQNISGGLAFDSDPMVVQVLLFVVNGTTLSAFFAPFVSSPSVGSLSQFDQPVLYYIDAGSTPTVRMNTGGAGFLGALSLTMTGYLLDCTVSPCAAIAQ